MKKSGILVIGFYLLNFNAFAGFQINEPGWTHPEITKEHSPFYTDSTLGIVIQGGNTIDNTIVFQTMNTLEQESDIYQIGGHYNYGWDEDGLASRNWDLRFRYERILREKVNLYGAYIIEGDPFAGFHDRANYDLGISFPFKGKIFSWEMEAGYRYTREVPTSENDRYQNKLRFHLGGSWKVAKTGEIRPWLRFMPFLSDSQGDLPNYMLDFGVYLNSYFSESFYLNLSLIGNYRKIPLEDRKQNDYKLIGSIGYKI